MKRVMQYLLLILTIACGLFFVLNKSLFLTWIVDPISRIVWFLYRLFRVFDQEQLWLFLILIVLIAVIWVISGNRETFLQSAYRSEDPIPDRVTFWQRLFQSAEKDVEKRALLDIHLKDLSDQIDALTQKSNNDDTDFSVLRKNPGGFLPAQNAGIGFFESKKKRIYRVKQRELYIDQIISSMESRMEIDNAQSTDEDR